MTTMLPEATIIRMRTKDGRSSNKKQILASLVISLGPFAGGLGKGYFSPAIASLQENNNTLNGGFTVSHQECSWIVSLSYLGALIGGALGGIVMTLGRRKVLLATAPPYCFAWILAACAGSVKMMYAASFIAGMLLSVMTMITQIYVSEIAEPEIRGRLSSLLKILSQVGILTSYCLGAYLNWHQLALVVAITPLLLFITLPYIPETPSFLLQNEQYEDAEKSLQWLRGKHSDIRQELATIRTNITASKQCSSGQRSWKIIFSERLTRPVLITCGVMLFARFTGAHTFSFFAVSTFRSIFKDISPHTGAITMSVVQLLASCLSGILIDRVGRLPLLITSGILMSLAYAGFGSYVFYEQNYKLCNVTANITCDGSYDWIPLTCVLTFTAAFALGISPISWLLIGELFPLEFRSLGSGVATVFSHICAFASTKSYIDFQDWFGLYWTFWIYSFIALLGLVFVFLVVPETKDKEMDEMDPKFIESLCINR